jgi:hypothetical protein
MKVVEAIQLLAGYPPAAELLVLVDGWNLPVKGHTTHGGSPGNEYRDVDAVVLFTNERVVLRLCTLEESDRLDGIREQDGTDEAG